MIKAKNIKQLDLNLLKIFECLYREKNMSETAKVENGVPVPPLWESRGGRSFPTQAGDLQGGAEH